MRVHIFDGRKLAEEKEFELKKEVKRLRKKEITPKLASILVGDNKASKVFLSLKKKAAERVGVELEIKKFQANEPVSQLIRLIKSLNQDNSVHGIMVQLPLPKSFSGKDRNRIIEAIASEKDVDGMRDDSQFLAPVVRAVLDVIKQAIPYLPLNKEIVVAVVGSKGFIGKKIVNVLKEMGYKVEGVDLETKSLKQKTKNADILISTTGSSGLISGDMVKSSAVVIDLGAPKGDVKFDEVVKKVSFISKKQTLFITPVPGGVGPVTISCLLENLVEAAS